MSLSRLKRFVSPDTLRLLLKTKKILYSGYTDKIHHYKSLKGAHYVGSVVNDGNKFIVEAKKIKNLKYNIEDNIYIPGYYADSNSYSTHYPLKLVDAKYLQKGYESYHFQNAIYLTKVLDSTDTITNSPAATDFYVFQSYEDSSDTVYKTKYSKVSNNANFKLNDIHIAHPSFPSATNQCTYYYKTATNSIDIVAVNPLLRYLPTFSLGNNKDVSLTHELLSLGVNGHNQHYLYPYCFDNNVPLIREDDPTTGKYWWIKLVAKNHGFDKDRYEMSEIKYIYYIYGTSVESPETGCTVILSMSEENAKYVNMKLIKNDTNTTILHFSDTKEVYCYTRLSNFYVNNVLEGVAVTVPFIQVIFNQDYVNSKRIELNQSKSGMYISTDERMKTLPFNLSKFDGLPDHLSYDNYNSNILEVFYTYRDNSSLINENVKDKQLSALILDSGLPQNEYIEVAGLNPSITYQYPYSTTENIPGFVFDSSEETIGDNYLTGIKYVSWDHVATEIELYVDYKNIVYHSGGIFSLGFVIFNTGSYGRVYYVNTDTCGYENNATTSNVKPARTIARVCDIPTSAQQLIQSSSALQYNLFDAEYVRSKADFSLTDLKMLYNEKANHVIRKSAAVVFDKDDTITTDMLANYKQVSNINQTITYSSSNVTITVASGGTGYAVNDTFNFYVGNTLIPGKVTAVDADTKATAVALNYTGDPPAINMNNMYQESTYLITKNVVGTGAGLKIKCTINSTIWTAAQRQYNTVIDDLVYFKYDAAGYVFAYNYGSTKGSPITGSFYDISAYNQYENHMTKDIELYNLLKIDQSYSNTRKRYPIDMGGESCNPITDYTSYLHNNGYVYGTGYTYYDTTYEQLIQIVPYNNQEIELPKQHDLNTRNTTNNNLMYDFNITGQPDVYFYNAGMSVVNSYYSDYKDKHIRSRTSCIDYKITDDNVLPGILSGNKFKSNVYEYTNTKRNSTIDALEVTLSEYTLEELITYIKDNYGEDCDALTQYETKEDLIRYAILYYEFTKDATKPDDIHKLISIKDNPKDEEVQEKLKIKGGVEKLNDERLDIKLALPGSGEVAVQSSYVNPLYVFKINLSTNSKTKQKQIQELEGNLDNYHLYDYDGNDISKYCMIIFTLDQGIEYKRYIYDQSSSSSSTWIEI